MREIRFRAWDDRDNSMWKFDLLETRTLGDIIALGFVMQYTGLKDKRQKEIYEGDLVKDGKGEKWIIEWCDQEVGWRLYKTFIYKNTTDVPSVVDFLDIEVIGNVYENPELLEK